MLSFGWDPCDIDNESWCERSTLYIVAGGVIKFWRTEWLVEYGNGPVGPTNDFFKMPNKAQDCRTGMCVSGITVHMLFLCKCAVFEKTDCWASAIVLSSLSPMPAYRRLLLAKSRYEDALSNLEN